MKYMFASDIHGSAYYCRLVIDKFTELGADRLILLGDLLYHGPRNELPRDYSPKDVFAMLNQMKDKICAVRGNCDSEVDQMVLEFPIMADYIMLDVNGLRVFATHGHIYNQDQLLPMADGDILIHGHTHVPVAEKYQNIYLLNPGSVSLPKEGNPCSYGILEDQTFTVSSFDGEIVKQIEFR